MKEIIIIKSEMKVKVEDERITVSQGKIHVEITGQHLGFRVLDETNSKSPSKAGARHRGDRALLTQSAPPQDIPETWAGPPEPDEIEIMNARLGPLPK